jgi:hypothetical protein
MKSAAIELPKPSFTIYYAHSESSRSVPTDFHLIDYYMTLSICPWVLGPSLWSIFWSPHVPFNRVGAWMAPIVDVLGPVIQNDDMELIAGMFIHTGALRRVSDRRHRYAKRVGR